MSGAEQGKAAVTLSFSPDAPKALGLVFSFDGMKVSETLGRPFRIQVEASSATPKGDLSKLLGARATVRIIKSGSDYRYFNGIVSQAVLRGISSGVFRYTLELRPWVWLLGHERDCRIFQKKSPFDIITDIFRDAGFMDFKDNRQNSSGGDKLDYCVQYRESTLDFVTRLMEQYGIYYFFTHEEQKHTLNLADDPNSHMLCSPDAISVQHNVTEVRQVGDHVWEPAFETNLRSGSFAARDYNFETPSADLTSKSLDNNDPLQKKWQSYDFPGLYDTADNGTKLMDIRMQSSSTQRVIFRGRSNSRLLFAGSKVKLAGNKDTALNAEYLVIAAEYAMELAEGLATISAGGENVDTFRVKITAVPGSTHFRLPQTTPRPIVAGLQTARVVGENGEEITVDQYGRIKVKFFWDRSDTQDENASCWIRVAQIAAGMGFGALHTPRIGQEVVVAFLEGNPDRPLIVGTVHNASMTVPYSLPDKKVISTIKTNSSKGGGGFNELRFDDTKGSEEVFLQAQYDHTVKILHDHKLTVTNDQVVKIEQGRRDVTVSQGNDSLTISEGDHKVSVTAGSSSLEAAHSIELRVGANSLKIDTSGVTINGVQLQMTASASAKLTANAPMTLQAPLININ